MTTSKFVRHANGSPLIEISNPSFYYVRIQATREHKGRSAAHSFMLLTPEETRDFAYQLRAVAERVEEQRAQLPEGSLL